MYFSEAVAAVLRRWYIVVGGLVLMVLGCVAMYLAVPTRYQANANVVVLPPGNQVAEGEPINKFLGLPSGVTMTATLLTDSVMSPDTQRGLVGEGYTSAYSVSVPPASGPLIVINVQDSDGPEALRLRDHLIDLLELELARIQSEEEVPADQAMEARAFSVGSVPEVVAGSKLRAMAAVSAVGLILTVLAVSIVDRRHTREISLGSVARLDREALSDSESASSPRPAGGSSTNRSAR